MVPGAQSFWFPWYAVALGVWDNPLLRRVDKHWVWACGLSTLCQARDSSTFGDVFTESLVVRVCASLLSPWAAALCRGLVPRVWGSIDNCGARALVQLLLCLAGFRSRIS